MAFIRRASGLDRASILLQDAATAERQALRACLNTLGEPIVEVSSGTAALQYLREHHNCAVAILDATSTDALGILESRAGDEDEAAIIFLTDAEREQAGETLARRRGETFSRPVDLDALRSRVAALVNLYREHHRVRREGRLVARRERAAREESDAGRAYLHSFLAQTPAVIARLSGPRHIFEYVNARYLEISGNKNPIGRSAREALPELEGEPFVAQLDEAFFSGEPQAASQVRLMIPRGRDGALEDAFFNFVYQPTRDRLGQVDGVLVHAVEVTALVKSRRVVEHLSEELRASELRLRAMAEAIPEQIWTARPDGRLEYANTRVLDYSGRTLAEVLAGGWIEDVHPDDAQPCRRAWQSSLATGDPFELEFRLERRSDAAQRWHLGRAVAARDEAGKILRWYGTLTDVHDQKAAEREAEELASFQQKLLAVVGHDLRTPLTSILATTQLLLDPFGPAGDAGQEQRERGLLRIARSGLRMKRMIDDLVGFSRARLGQGLNLVSEPCRIADLCEQVIDEVLTVHPDRKIRLDVRDPGVVAGDSSRLAQVIANLLSNAVQYAAPGSEITVLVALERDDVLLAVTNQGPPIPARKLRTLFQPFKRRAREPSANLGLGLFIVEQVVRAHGGTVEVESDAQQGTSFTVRLPRAPAGEGGSAGA
jgi:PAS domain S-box-containing protein